MHELSRSALRYIREQRLLRPGDRVGVAVSGGVDSVALLRILLELRAELGLVLSVVHVNHCLRGAESESDGQFVAMLAAECDLPFFSARRDVKVYAAEKKLSVETAARAVRYQYFQELLQSREFNRLATAHTLDDQAETVLLKLTRGAGTRGLAGIYPCLEVESAQNQQTKARGCKSDLAIVRPLLGSTRSDLEEYLRLLKQPWREDSSNALLHHTRNRIRHEILSRLCAEVNPQARHTLAEVAEIARAEEEFWHEEIQQHLAEVWVRSERGGTLRFATFTNLSLALRRRLLRAAAESLGLNLEFKHVEEILAAAEKTKTALPNDWIARRAGEVVYFERGRNDPAQDYEYELAVPGRIEVPEANLVLSTVLSDHSKTGPHPPDRVLDARFANTLIIRDWRAGDRFWPANSKQPKKVKALLQDRHITGEEKKRWPVIVSGSVIVWMRGFGIARDAEARNGGVLIREEAMMHEDRDP